MPKMMPRVVVIGLGAAAQEFHLPALRHLGIQPTAAVDPSPAALDIARRQWGIRDVYRNHGSLDPRGIDLCLICSPPATHAEISEYFLSAGVHCLVEKPAVLNANEEKLLLECEEKAGASCFVGHMRRFFPSLRLLQELLASGVFGRIRSVLISEGGPFRWPTRSLYQASPTDEGVITDRGAHAFDLAAYLAGLDSEPVQVDECLVDRYPQTNNLEVRARTGDVALRFLVSRTSILPGTVTITTDHAVLRTASDFSGEPPVAVPRRGGQPIRLAPLPYSFNMKYIFVLQLQDVMRSIHGDEAGRVCPRLREVSFVQRMFEVVRGHISLIGREQWGLEALAEVGRV